MKNRQKKLLNMISTGSSRFPSPKQSNPPQISTLCAIIPRNHRQAITPYTRNSMKCFWLRKPTQLLIQGQWWSMFSMHFLQIVQWWALGGLTQSHTPQGMPSESSAEVSLVIVPGSVSTEAAWQPAERQTVARNAIVRGRGSEYMSLRPRQIPM